VCEVAWLDARPQLHGGLAGSSRLKGANGLGLSVVKTSIDLHGATIGVRVTLTSPWQPIQNQTLSHAQHTRSPRR
jgi:hypothetical protein